VDLVVEPHVGHGHAVLGQRARLVGADGGGGAESLYGLQVLHQAVLLGHSLGSESQTHLGEQRVAMGEGGNKRRKDEEVRMDDCSWTNANTVCSSVCACETMRGPSV